jgi:hypothetical protein
VRCADEVQLHPVDAEGTPTSQAAAGKLAD